MRTQMPQTQKRGKNTGKKKQFDRNACLLVTVQIFAGILIFLLLTASDNKKLNNTLDETFDFAKNRIESYEIYNTNDQVKSLVRLMDKTTELSRVLAQEENLSAEMLDEYAREQRLTGILVLDQRLNVEEQTQDGDSMPLCNLCAACTASFFSLSSEQKQNRKKKYPSGSEETSSDQCTGSCIFLYFSCEFKNRGNRSCKIFKLYEAGSEG